MKLRSVWLPQWKNDPNVRRLAWRFCQSLITLSLLLWLLSRVDSKTVRAITSFPPAVLAISLAVFATSQIFGSFRLWVLLRSQETYFPSLYLMRLTFIGFFTNNFLPSTIGGDIYKAVALTREGKGLKITILTLVADRVLSLMVTVLMTAAALPFTTFWSMRSWMTGFPSLQFLAICIAIVVAVVFTTALMAHRIKSFRSLVEKLRERMTTVAERALRFITNPGALATAILLSCLSIAASILAQLIIADTLGISIDVIQLTAVIGLVTLAAMIPVSINGIGLQEAGLVTLLHLLGIAQEPAIAFAILSRVLILGTSIVGGVLLMFSRRSLTSKQR